MTKTLFAAIFIFFFYFHSIAQVTDVGPNGKQYYRAVEGGSVKVEIDTISSLATLINKLDGNWEFEETGKMYWIGYTDDMFSIAAHKDSAIEPLIEHFYSTKSEKGKYGVIYALHLIGIESSIAGRFIEDFKNENARKALLKLATDKKYTGAIVALLGRDPWKTDLPALLEILKQDHYNVELINALFRYTAAQYEENDFPFRQIIPQALDTFNVLMQDSSTVFQAGTLIKISELEANKKKKGNPVTKENSKPIFITTLGYGVTIINWKFIMNEKEIQKINLYFNCNKKESITKNRECIEEYLDGLLSLSWEKISPFSYVDYGDHFQYYFEENNLIICTVEQSAKRWLDYFAMKGNR